MTMKSLNVAKWDREENGVDIVREFWDPTPEEFEAYRVREGQLAAAEKAKGTDWEDTLYHIFSWGGIV